MSSCVKTRTNSEDVLASQKQSYFIFVPRLQCNAACQLMDVMCPWEDKGVMWATDVPARKGLPKAAHFEHARHLECSVPSQRPAEQRQGWNDNKQFDQSKGGSKLPNAPWDGLLATHALQPHLKLVSLDV